MLHLFLTSVARYLRFVARSFAPPRDGMVRLTPRRVLLMLAFLPAFGIAQAFHWLGFLLDEVFFRGYRRVVVREPLFVTGVPRSGTTMLHRVLADDERFTTFSTWECLLAPSVTERRVLLGLAALDRAVGRPGARLVGWLERRVFGALDGVHSMDLAAPEEDYFAFMPILACFILVVPFPFSSWLWRMGTFDRDMDPDDRRRVMAYYHRCLQKHLYVHGEHRRLLSKNASFSPLVGSLLQTFPDARLICCMREPVATVASQLSSLEGGMALFDCDRTAFRRRLTEQLEFYYENLLDTLQPLPAERCVFLRMGELKSGLARSVGEAYGQLGIELSPAFDAHLRSLEDDVRSYRSGHRYSLEQFGLDEATVRRRFAGAYARFDFRRPPAPAVAEAAG